jgi:hypothetical protein
MTIALIAAAQSADPPHSSVPWYLGIPVVVVPSGCGCGAAGAGAEAGAAEAAGRLAAAQVINDEPLGANRLTGIDDPRHFSRADSSGGGK